MHLALCAQRSKRLRQVVLLAELQDDFHHAAGNTSAPETCVERSALLGVNVERLGHIRLTQEEQRERCRVIREVLRAWRRADTDRHHVALFDLHACWPVRRYLAGRRVVIAYPRLLALFRPSPTRCTQPLYLSTIPIPTQC